MISFFFPRDWLLFMDEKTKVVLARLTMVPTTEVGSTSLYLTAQLVRFTAFAAVLSDAMAPPRGQPVLSAKDDDVAAKSRVGVQ